MWPSARPVGSLGLGVVLRTVLGSSLVGILGMLLWLMLGMRPGGEGAPAAICLSPVSCSGAGLLPCSPAPAPGHQAGVVALARGVVLVVPLQGGLAAGWSAGC